MVCFPTNNMTSVARFIQLLGIFSRKTDSVDVFIKFGRLMKFYKSDIVFIRRSVIVWMNMDPCYFKCFCVTSNILDIHQTKLYDPITIWNTPINASNVKVIEISIDVFRALEAVHGCPDTHNFWTVDVQHKKDTRNILAQQINSVTPRRHIFCVF